MPWPAPDGLPHIKGGDESTTIMLSMTALNGILFAYSDETMQNGWTLSIEQNVDGWNMGTIYRAPRKPE
jgi:hypothetical protein